MAAEVSFGGVPATDVVIVNDTTITCTTPAGTGDVDVTIDTSGGSVTWAAAFTYAPAPSITALDPASGPEAGGTSVTITGTGYDVP